MSIPPTNDETDCDQLVEQAKTQREAFAALYDRYFPRIHRYCQRRLLDCAMADDLSSEVFLNIAQSIRRFPGTTETDFRRWAYRIATNVINAHFRKRKRRQALFERAAGRGWWNQKAKPDSQGSAQADDQSENLVQALATLTVREQTVLTLRYWEGLSYEEVGQIIEARAETVRVVASRAIQALREKLVKRQSIEVAPNEGRKP
jgi:RNA polymerase sigma-70 factor (ECF subfamily)